MVHSLTDQQVTLLRLAKRSLALPAREPEDGNARDDLALLVMLHLVEPQGQLFCCTEAGRECLRRIDAGDQGVSDAE